MEGTARDQGPFLQGPGGQDGTFAAGPIATGIRPGDRVGLMAPTSLEWAICVFAIGALATFRPTILLTVPRMLEKVAAAARQQAEAEGHRRLFAAAEATAVAWSRAGGRARGWGTRCSAARSTHGCAMRWAGRWPG